MEFWDIYDENKKPTGRTMKRNDWCLKDGEYHLTVLGVVGRPDGTFLITKRVMTKAWAPGWWEVSGGAAQAGEESCEAVLREVKEETGLDVINGRAVAQVGPQYMDDRAIIGELNTAELDAGEPDGIRAKRTACGKHAHTLGSTQTRRAHGFRPFCVGAGPVLRFGIGGYVLSRAAGRSVFEAP